MKNLRVQLIAVAVMVSGLVPGTAYAQEHDHSASAKAPAAKAPAAKAASAARPAAAAEHPPEVFCGTMKTGQLCSMGTVTLLGLTPEKREVWLTAVRTYNRTVNDAIIALQVEAGGALSAAQVEEVNRWFAIGVNPQINQLLAATANAKAAK